MLGVGAIGGAAVSEYVGAVHADDLWRLRHLDVEAVAARLGVVGRTLHRWKVGTGWAWDANGEYKGQVSQAPCRECETPTPIGDLSLSRVCLRCRYGERHPLVLYEMRRRGLAEPRHRWPDEKTAACVHCQRTVSTYLMNGYDECEDCLAEVRP